MFPIIVIDLAILYMLKFLYSTAGISFGTAYGKASKLPAKPVNWYRRTAYLLSQLTTQELAHRLLLCGLILYYRFIRRIDSRYVFKWLGVALLGSRHFMMVMRAIAPITQVSVSLMLLYLVVAYVHLSCQLVPFAKLLFAWLSVGAFFYLLISGFVYFTNKLAYAGNVDVIQRFWKRTFSIFWLIESGLFAFFVYMTMNASSEVWAAYDTPSLFKTQFFSLRMLFVRLSLISMTILLTSILAGLAARQDSYGELPIQMAVTSCIVLSLWIESYQFYLFILCSPSYSWVFNADIHETIVESDTKRNRLLRNFVFVCGVVKFWHFLFIAINWLFYLNRQLEHADVRLGLLNSSMQNLLILYLLNLIAMFPYVKHLIHKGLAKPYFWFLVDEGTNVFVQAFELTYIFYTSLIY